MARLISLGTRAPLGAGLAAVLAAVLPLASARAQLPARPERADVAARVDSIVRAHVGDGGAASIAVAVVRGGDTLVRRAWGMADISARRPATEATTYRIGSVSKQFTATLILGLVERGRLSLDDTLGRYLTGLRPEWNAITIAQLLNHTSGLHREYRQPERRSENLPSDTLVAFATRGRMLSAPGTRFSYSNTGYMLLGVLVEKRYGKPYGQVLRDEIARPLGLASLGWCIDVEQGPRAARGHQRSEQGALGPASSVNPAQGLGAGGICATAGDLAAWNRALHGGHVLAPASYAAMTTPRGAAVANGYGFGVRAQRTAWGSRMIGHNGATPGFHSENAYFPAESLSVTILYNTTPLPVGGQLLSTLAHAALGLPLPSRTAAVPVPETENAPDAPAPRLEVLAGEYALIAGRTITVTLEHGRLHGQPTGSAKVPLVHLSGATFAVGRPDGRTTVTFALGADGRATAMVMRQNGRERTLPRVR